MKISLFLLLLCSGFLTAQDLFFADEPTLTPDGKEVVFSYNTDLWRVPAAGGPAIRVTALEGKETNPSISPDGKWLAFSSDQYGNKDVFAVPMAGGQITQLTFHQADDQVESWSWDSQRIYFTSGRYNRMATYTVGVAGGTPTRLFGENYFNNVHNAAEHPDGSIYFNESWESSLFVHRKRYRGPFNPDIKSYQPKTDTYTKHTDWEGKDMLPVIDRTGNIYFVSDRDNDEYNLYELTGTSARRLFSTEHSVFSPCVSADGSTLAYIKDYQLYTYGVANGEERKVPVVMNGFEGLAKQQDFTTNGKVTAFDVAGDGKKIAFVSRGELFVSDIKGDFIQELKTGDGRVGEVHWLKDHRTLLYNTTVDGYQNWFTLSADGTGEPKQRSSDLRNNRMLVISHDTTRAVYLSGRDELRLMDLKTFKSEVLVTDEFWAVQNSAPRWSPDDAYLAFNVRRDFEMDIFIYDVKKKEAYNLTNTGVSEYGPYWSPDAKYLYFASARHQPGYPRGGGDMNVYRLPLQRYGDPFRSERFARLFAEDSTAVDSVTRIDPVHIMERMEQIGTAFGDQGSVAVIQDGDEQVVLYGGDQEEGKTKLYKTVLRPFEDEETSSISGDGIGGADDLVTADGKYYLMGNGKILSLNLKENKTEPIDLDFTFRRVLRPEFEQMYYETWANLEQNFYDADFHNVDFRALRDQYAAFLPYVNTRADLRRLTNDLLGELNTSHFGFYSSGDEEKTTFGSTTLDMGLEYLNDDPYVIASVIPDGPADYFGADLRPGDRLVALNGVPFDSKRNREYYFAQPSVDPEVTLTVARGGRNLEVRIHPQSYNQVNDKRYDQWVNRNQQLVDEETDRKVAYVHMKNMGDGELNHFLDEMVSEGYQRAGGLILDLRYNTGGNVHDAVLQFLSQRPYLNWKYRSGALSLQPNFAPEGKPIVLLINQQSLSDAEMTAAGFRELGLGTIVGTPTYRWIIFTTGGSLVDGSYYRLPSWGTYTLDGKNLEKTGVEPDVRIDNTMADRLHDRDPQLERAVEVVLKGRQGKR